MTSDSASHFDSWTRAYALLGLRLDRIVDGTVDAWTGPSGWRDQVHTEPIPSAPELKAEAERLLDALGGMRYDPHREEYLRRQVIGVRTVAAIANGERIPFREQIRLLYDVEPSPVPDSSFADAHRLIDDVLPGTGSLAERIQSWRAGLAVPLDQLPALVDRITAEVRRRTTQHYRLPEHEGVEVRLVTDEPWSGYNWYLGHTRSRIEINTDLPVYAHSLVDLMAHEGYPGHHTEHALREVRQFHEDGQAEYAIQLISTPECVVSEGISTSAREMIFDGDDDLRWLAGQLPVGIELDPEQAGAIRRALRMIGAVSGNAAFLLHEEGRPESEVVEYIAQWELRSPDEALKRIEFIASPLWRAYVFTYSEGHRLLEPILSREDRHRAFERVLTEPMYPERWRRMAATPASRS